MGIEHCSDEKQRYMALRLRMFDDGYARLDSTWNMRDVCSPYTRLYYVYDGEGWVNSPSGEHKLRAGRMYLIPSGLKFDYRCDNRLDKLYMHVVLEMPDGFDMLGSFGDVLEMDMPDGLGAEILAAHRRKDMASAFRMKGCVMDTIAQFMEAYGAGLMPISSYSPANKRRVQADKAGFEFASYIKGNRRCAGHKSEHIRQALSGGDGHICQRLYRQSADAEVTAAAIVKRRYFGRNIGRAGLLRPVLHVEVF